MFIVVDTNHLFNRNYHVFAARNSNFLTGNEEDRIMLKKACYASILNDCKQFGRIDGIILARDSQSWRYGLLADYKKPRHDKPSSRDVKEFEACMDEFCDDMYSAAGILSAKGPGLEADDIIYGLTARLTRKTDCVVFSGDHDLHQLIGYGKNGFTCVFDGTYSKKLFYINDEIKRSFCSSDIFATINPSQAGEVIHSNAYEVVNPEEVLFVKIISGDKSDNIDRCTPKATPRIAKKLYGLLEPYGNVVGKMCDPEDGSFRGRVALKLLTLSKSSTDLLGETVKGISRNTRAIRLHKSSYDSAVLESLMQAIGIDKRGLIKWGRLQGEFMSGSLMSDNEVYSKTMYFHE